MDFLSPTYPQWLDFCTLIVMEEGIQHLPFYMGINLGALISPIIVGGLGDTGNPANFMYGFLAAGFGMIIGLVVLILGKNIYLVDPEGNAVGEVPNHKFDPDDCGNKSLHGWKSRRLG